MSIRERDIADWICAYPETLWEGLEIIGREITLKHGRLDLLGWDKYGTQVIELKIGALKERHIGQVLRYRHDVCVQLGAVGHSEYPLHWPNKDGYEETPEERLFRQEWNWHHSLSMAAEGAPSIQAVLIGESIDDTVLAATSGASITVMVWDYADGNFQFRHVVPKESFVMPGESIGRWAYTISHRALHECVKATRELSI